MEVIEVKPKYTTEQLSLQEEQKQLTDKLLLRMKKDIINLNDILDKIELRIKTEAIGFSFDVTACFNNLRQTADEKLDFLEHGKLDDMAHVNLVNNLSNKYHLDNVIR